MLGGIEAEAVNAVRDCGLQEVLHAVGHILVLRVQVPQAKQVALGHIAAAGIVDLVAVVAAAVGTGVEVVFVLPIGVDGAPVGGEVVGYHVYDYAHAVLVCSGGHFLQIVFAADHEVADGGVRRLVHVIPVFGELLAVGGDFLDFAHRLGLHGGVAGRGDFRHMFGDSFERPHPRMQDGAVLHALGQAVLFAGLLERGIADRILVAVTVRGECGGGHAHAAQHGGDGRDSGGGFLPRFDGAGLAGRLPALDAGHRFGWTPVLRGLLLSEYVRNTCERTRTYSHFDLLLPCIFPLKTFAP